MSITFRCEHCRKEVEAPDGAAGKRGKCPFCGQSNYIPLPVSEDDLLPLAPIDDEEEQHRRQEIQELIEQERELAIEGKGQLLPPLDHREDLKSQDLHHFVVNYCLDIAGGQRGRAETHAEQLRRSGQQGLQAVDDFITGKAIEAALDAIPTGTLQGYLKHLRERVST
jgi:phage FluMu protein Com